MEQPPVSLGAAALTVSQLNRMVKELLESGMPLLWVEGELSNVSRPASGHLYFTLKDRNAQVRCAMFRMRASLLRFVPESGMQVRLRARVGLYEPRGDYQLIAEQMEEAGDGALQRALETLKRELAARGWLAAERKRPLPARVRQIGVVTSPSGAAIRDVLSVLARRWAALPVVIYPTPVQGAEAPQAVARAIRTAGERGECDVLIVTRGGGSLEDLWAFNEEVVAQAIVESPIPVVSAVGHEVDVTLADLVADLRAATPSAAAELVSPDRAAWQARLQRLEGVLHSRMQRWLAEQRRRLQGLQGRLRHPGRRLQEWGQRVDELERRLLHGWRQRLARDRLRLASAHRHLRERSPRHALSQAQERCHALDRRLQAAMQYGLERRRQRLLTQARALEAVSPLATLQRGYAIARDSEGRVVRRAGQCREGARLSLRLGQGELICQVEEVRDENG